MIMMKQLKHCISLALFILKTEYPLNFSKNHFSILYTILALRQFGGCGWVALCQSIIRWHSQRWVLNILIRDKVILFFLELNRYTTLPISAIHLIKYHYQRQ